MFGNKIINADDLFQVLRDDYNINGANLARVRRHIEAAPAVDAVYGRWISHNKGNNNWVECSKCNTVGSPFWKRCPVCEAKMDGGNEDG